MNLRITKRKNPPDPIFAGRSRRKSLRFIFVCSFVVTFTASSGTGPFQPSKIRNWIYARCGGKGGSAIWAFEGALYDPLDGRKIANVEGLQLVRHVADYQGMNPDEYRKRCWDLKFPNFISKQSLNTYAATILSRNVYCYQTLDEQQQRPRLLDSIRLRPNAPLRKIPTQQAVAIYDAATTFLSHDDGNEFIVHTESPNGKCLWSRAAGTTTTAVAAAFQNDTLEFTVHTGRRHKDDFPDLKETNKKGDQRGVVVAPKRSKLVQFGASQNMQQQKQLAARETYLYTMEAPRSTNRPFLQFLSGWKRRADHAYATVPSCRVRYTRYGEGPPWYGPGKFCTLELQGRKVPSVTEAPPLVVSLAAKHGLLSLQAPLPQDESEDSVRAAQQAIKLFREGITWKDEESDSVPSNKLQRMARRLRKGSVVAVQRLRAASRVLPSD